MFEQLGVIGCGLMGGSFALALKRAGLVKRVIGYSKSPSTTEQAQAARRHRRRRRIGAARRLGLRHRADRGAGRGDRGDLQGDPPPGRAGHAGDGRRLDQARRRRRRAARAEGPHRLLRARRTRSPARKCRASSMPTPTLYHGRQVILTPLRTTAARAGAEGAPTPGRRSAAQVLQMTPEDHDAAFAAVSHLPHMLAFALFNAIAAPAGGARLPRARRARAFATSRASPRATRRCGATS